VNEHFALADHFKLIAVHHDSGALIDANAQQFGMPGNDWIQVILAVAGENVLVDGGIAQKAEALFVPRRHHYRVAFRGAPNQIRSLNGSSGRTSTDDASSFQYADQFLFRARIQV